MRSANGLRALFKIFMQSPQVILLRSFCITTYYMFSVSLQGELRRVGFTLWASFAVGQIPLFVDIGLSLSRPGTFCCLYVR